MRILWLSDPPVVFTGFGTVSRELLARFSKISDLEVGCLVFSLNGWPYPPEALPYPVYCCSDRGGDTFAKAIAEFRPDVLVTLGDLDWSAFLVGRKLPFSFKWWPYFPLDFAPMPQSWAEKVRSADLPIAYSEFGRKLVQAEFSGEVEMIYHGVHCRLYHPLEDRDVLRQRVGLHGRFVVGCVARNHPRKHFPILMRAFSRFSGDKPEALLYLHTNPKDEVGLDLIDLAHRYGIADRTAATTGYSVYNGVRTGDLNEIYNVFDVFALPTGGEGFCLPLVEAMAAGVPIIATDYTACTELLQGRGELLRVRLFQTTGRNNVDIAIPDEDHLVELLDQLYASPERRAEMAAKGREFALQLDWDIIAQQWVELFRKHGAAGR